ncbi:putative oxidase (copper-binding protein) [Ktedonobacteria bacterium brp13]|nr:putative oxidase (copper-binding protein) [Ktedonobacteria bacterium brp13]
METQQVNGKSRSNVLVLCFFVFIVLLIFASIGWQFASKQQLAHLPANSANSNTLAAPQIPAGAPNALNMGMPGGKLSITNLRAPLTAAHMKNFTLVAQPAHLSLGNGFSTDAWTFNGTAPGPTLHVKQGDLVVVKLVNHLSFGVTIHWHGIDVPNSADGVAGVTQDAVKPGQSYVYRFFVNTPGTYWYHSHQFSYAETDAGLYGMIIVDPTTPTYHADVDYSLALHEWNGSNNQSILAINNTVGTLSAAARPGQWVRLRIVNTSATASSAPQLVTLIGAPFKVIALDGQDLNEPQMLNETPIPLGSAQRYDLLFQMPAHGSVTLVTASDTEPQHYQTAPAVLLGQGTVPTLLPSVTKWFDLTTYGRPTQTAITPQSHFDQTYSMVLNNQIGNSLGRMGMTYTINGKVFPNTGMIMVHEGQLIQIHIVNQSNLYHPMHLHGHTFTVLTHDGQPLTGSPVRLDTILVPPHQSYDIGFLANNPGIWMLHCHNLLHANWGMDMMVMYDNYTTPFTVGKASGNSPD